MPTSVRSKSTPARPLSAAGPGGPLLTFASVDADAKAIAAGTAGEVTFKAASVHYRQSAGAQPVKLDGPQVTAKSVSLAQAFDAAAAVVWNGDRVAGDVRLPALAQLLEGKPSPVRVKIAAPKGNLDIDGAFALVGGAAKIEGKANAAAAFAEGPCRLGRCSAAEDRRFRRRARRGQREARRRSHCRWRARRSRSMPPRRRDRWPWT